ncbi:Agmatine deiminase (EC [Olavius sp. associated proteobacterium Delta 1]|nr:Agmatine deiminase (EC [Olavius sp. associated proteobacterium Delta 1]
MVTPADENFYMPAEWHPHSACWMAWPSAKETYQEAPEDPAVAFEKAKIAYSRVANAIAGFEPVNMISNPADADEARRMCNRSVNLIEAEIDDGWLRDSGPTFLVNPGGETAGVDWAFNGWGKKCEYAKDALIAEKVLGQAGVKRFACPLVLEGGGIHVDGEGTLLVTENCLLNQNRNPDLNKTQVEAYLRRYLNVEKIIWLNGHIPADMTDGHIDGLACFIRPGVVLAASPADESHPDFDVLQENLATLRESTDAKGRSIEVVEMATPCKRLDNGMIVDACYVNFYIANRAVIVPSYNIPDEDRQAYELFKNQFPGHEVIQLDTEVLHYGGGNIHCITQQQPEPDPPEAEN